MPPGASPPRLLEGAEEACHGGDLGGVRDLGQRQDEARGQARRGVEERGEEEVEGADAPFAHGGFHALDPDADPGGDAGGVGGGARGGDEVRGAQRVGVLLGVGPHPVPVLEVDPQVLDGLGAELGAHARVHLGGERGGEAHGGGERGGVGRVGVERGERLIAPRTDGARPEDVGGHVHRVHGLPGARIAWVTPRQFGVDGGEEVRDLLRGVRPERAAYRLPRVHAPSPVLNNLLREGKRARTRESTAPAGVRPSLRWWCGDGPASA